MWRTVLDSFKLCQRSELYQQSASILLTSTMCANLIKDKRISNQVVVIGVKYQMIEISNKIRLLQTYNKQKREN